MTIERIDNSRLLISLCKYDMERLDLQEKNLTLKNPYFKDTIKAILSVAMCESGISGKGKKAYIEALPYDEGCFIMVSFVEKEKRDKKYRVRKKKNHIYIFSDFEDIISLCDKLLKRDEKMGGNCVFECTGKYYLYIEDCSTQCEKLIEEFGKKILISTIDIARFNEYANIIAKNNAISKIGHAFL